MRRYVVDGIVTITFTDLVEASSKKEAMRKVLESKAVDLTWDSEKIEIQDCNQSLLPGEKPSPE